MEPFTTLPDYEPLLRLASLCRQLELAGLPARPDWQAELLAAATPVALVCLGADLELATARAEAAEAEADRSEAAMLHYQQAMNEALAARVAAEADLASYHSTSPADAPQRLLLVGAPRMGCDAWQVLRPPAPNAPSPRSSACVGRFPTFKWPSATPTMPYTTEQIENSQREAVRLFDVRAISEDFIKNTCQVEYLKAKTPEAREFWTNQARKSKEACDALLAKYPSTQFTAY